jgi:hypothetical protein
LSADSTWDFGSGSSQVITFSSLASYTPGSVFHVESWGGNPSGGGTDQLVFNSTGGVTAGFLSDVWFGGYPQGAALLGSGEVVPVPEPASVVALAALAGMILWRERRRLGFGRR